MTCIWTDPKYIELYGIAESDKVLYMVTSITAPSSTYVCINRLLMLLRNYIFMVVSVCLWVVHTYTQYIYACGIHTPSSVFSLLLDTAGFESHDIVEEKPCFTSGNELLDETVVICSKTNATIYICTYIIYVLIGAWLADC